MRGVGQGIGKIVRRRRRGEHRRPVVWQQCQCDRSGSRIQRAVASCVLECRRGRDTRIDRRQQLRLVAEDVGSRHGEVIGLHCRNVAVVVHIADMVGELVEHTRRGTPVVVLRADGDHVVARAVRAHANRDDDRGMAAAVNVGHHRRRTLSRRVAPRVTGAGDAQIGPWDDRLGLPCRAVCEFQAIHGRNNHLGNAVSVKVKGRGTLELIDGAVIARVGIAVDPFDVTLGVVDKQVTFHEGHDFGRTIAVEIGHAQLIYKTTCRIDR